MIAFSRYYNFSAEEVEYVEATDSEPNKDYFYWLTVHTKSGQAFSVNYKDAKSRNDDRIEMIHNIDCQKRQESKKVLSMLYIIKYTVELIDKRVLRIWRQLRDLLRVRVEKE